MDDFSNMFFLLRLEKLIRQRKRIRAELELEKQKDSNSNYDERLKNELSSYSMYFENLEFEEISDECLQNIDKNLTMRMYKKSDLMPEYRDPKLNYTMRMYKKSAFMPEYRDTKLFSNDDIIKKIKIVPNIKIDTTIPKEKYKYRLTEMCEICGMIFRRKNMVYHMNTHLKIKPYVCNYNKCRKSFASRSTLYNHRKLHTTIKNFKCDICSATFHFNGSLQKHKATHSDAKLKCSICNRKFKTKHCLKYHMKTHNYTGEAICTVPSCNRKFKSASGVTEHIRRFHKIKVRERVFLPST